ncbi:MAG: EamA family transporter [Syntrophobacteria bacterium]
MRTWLLNSLMALCCFGLWAFLPKVAVKYISPKSALVYEVLGGMLVGFVVLLSLDKRLEANIKGIIPALLTGIVGYIGFLFFLYAVQAGKVSIVASLTAVYPLVAVILAMIFLGEKIHVLQYIGIVFALVSVVLLSYR